MNLLYDESVETPYPKLGEEPEDKKIKNVWMFPDIKRSFPDIYNGGELVISPYTYYVTSGEALRKTETLINDIRDLMNQYCDNDSVVSDLSDLFVDVGEFYEMLIMIKNSSKFLEVTKCEDGIYSGNICARKDPKKKK